MSNMSDIIAKTTKEDIINGSYDRPAGVSLLAILTGLGSGALLISQLLVFTKLTEASSTLGMSTMLLQGGIGFLGLLGLAATVGMWLGKKWGWWLTLFYFAYAVARNINVMISIASLTEQWGIPRQGVGMTYAKYGIRVLWNGFLLFYLCRESATTFFGTTEIKKWKALLIVFALCAAVFVIGSSLQE
ncbi:hypothetical protein FE783_24680 [Paenibacillus mesophilus]|uniref:hypothetical protein n=1 Tax=Paenibacillus mesophilus TaxID=2582849 RepID=UPI00110DD759|nr:hypothetical protein [Paenibacillus mesophilus]TMV46838.1 hypothetical protein FE783_24680 [Paenibacillus mesophilus]